MTESVELAGVLELLDRGGLVLDVRSEAEFAGLAGYPCDPRQGHIPGARHLDLAHLIALRRDEIREAIGGAEGAEVVAYCHSGSRSETAAALLRAAGYRASNYVGSWHEWSRRDELAVETGATPPP